MQISVTLKGSTHFTATSCKIYLIQNNNELESLTFISTAEKLYAQQQLTKHNSCLIQQYPNQQVWIGSAKSDLNTNALKEHFRQLGASCFKKLCEEEVIETALNANINPTYALAFTEGFLLTAYNFNKYKQKPKTNSVQTLTIADTLLNQEVLNELINLVTAVYWVRDLINEPASALNAEQLAEAAMLMGQQSGFLTQTFYKSEIEAMNMQGLLAVNRGSVDPPTFSVLTWKPANATNQQPLVLVGKGVTFDTGGLSLKPTENAMDYMKCDMSGAGAVMGLLYTVAKNQLPVWVVGLIPATDNRPGANAYAPGDVVHMKNGVHVEVLNTDAEGRMILADALIYAQQLNPLLTIDLATLTGAALITAGSQGCLGMGNAPNWLSKLEASGYNVHERVVPMPFWDEFDDMIKSEVADIVNAAGREGGSITAGKFLERFVNYPWVHLDIAGPAFLKKENGYRPKGGVGTGIRLVYDFIKNNLL